MTPIEPLLTTILAPISESSPCGDDYLFSAEFDAITNARKFDDPTLDQGDWETELKEANWPFVIENTTRLLTTKTKDIRLVVWLTEALAIKKGFSGLAQGFSMIAKLCDQYWVNLHPLPDDDDLEQRIGNMGWLLTRTIQLVRDIPITHSDKGCFTALQWETANNLAQAIKRAPDQAEELARGKVSMLEFDAAKAATQLDFYEALLADLNACAVAIAQLESILDSKLGGRDGPSFSATKNAVETICLLVERFHRDAGGQQVQSDQATIHHDLSNEHKAFVKKETMNIAITGDIKNRAHALALLREVAAFFRETEPHSPVAYLAEKAAKSGETPLPIWLRSVIKDDASFAHIEEMLGFDETK